MRGEAVKISENWINSWGKLFLGDYRVGGWVEEKKYTWYLLICSYNHITIIRWL